MAESDQGEKIHPPSERRLQEARDKGDIARSREIPSAAILLASGAGLLAFAPAAANKLLVHAQRSLELLARPAEASAGLQLLVRDALTVYWGVLGPIFALLAGVALAAHLGQTGLLWSPKLLLPDLQRLNPLGRLKEYFFSTRTLAELGKVLLKLVAVGVPLSVLLERQLGLAAGLVGVAPASLAGIVLDGVTGILLKIGAAFVLIAALDFLWQRHTVGQKLKMTHTEIKQENKEQQGDPQVKGRVRRIQRELAMNRMMADVARADVVVTNPDHFAVALRYRPEEASAPRVLAKGVDSRAQQIKELAFRHGVPIVENRPLARALYKQVKVGRLVPAELYQAVSVVLAYVYRCRLQRDARRRSTRRAGSGR